MLLHKLMRLKLKQRTDFKCFSNPTTVKTKVAASVMGVATLRFIFMFLRCCEEDFAERGMRVYH